MKKATNKQRLDNWTEAQHKALDPLIGPEAVNKWAESRRDWITIRFQAIFTLVTTAAIFGILYLLGYYDVVAHHKINGALVQE